MISLCSCNAAREHRYCANVLIEMLAPRNSRSMAGIMFHGLVVA